MTAVPMSARAVADDWATLQQTAASDRFELDMLDALPDVAGRLIAHQLAPGVPLSATVELEMHGQIRLGSWRRFSARQVLTPGQGFVWAATARVAGLPVTGFDRFSRGAGEMRWRLLGLVPVMSASGPDVTRSAAGRLAAEAVLCPTAFRTCRWSEAGEDRVTMTWTLDGHDEDVELEVDREGRLRRVIMQRWGEPDGAAPGRYPFGVEVLEERSFGGVVLPQRFRAGWWWGTAREAEGEFFRAVVTSARFR